jgi:hypothetical protein
MERRPDGGESLVDVLGGRRGAMDASLPAAAFGVGWLIGDGSVRFAVGAAVGCGLAVAGWRLSRGRRPRAVVLGLLGVCLAALVVLRTGRAVDFFLVQLVANAGSALLFVAGNLVRWPLLGVVVGMALGQRARWRRDPALLAAYRRGSWVWAAQYLLRVAVFAPLYLSGHVVALAAARIAMTWPLVAVTLAVSWWVVRRSLPDGHPGLRHPREEPGEPTPAARSGRPLAG